MIDEAYVVEDTTGQVHRSTNDWHLARRTFRRVVLARPAFGVVLRSNGVVALRYTPRLAPARQ